MIKSVVWSSMIDYPKQTSTVLFVGVCNWNCEFCHNKTISNLQSIDFGKDILPKLIERQKLINHVVISGGECTDWTGIWEVVCKLKSHGFKVGIHTNGNNHCALSIFLETLKHLDLLDFVGMDIKTSLNNPNKYNDITQCDVNIDLLKESISTIVNSGVEYEFRTTLFPKHVDINDCVNIAKYLASKNVKEYYLQQFDDSVVKTGVKPYSKNILNKIQKECNNYLYTYIK